MHNLSKEDLQAFQIAVFKDYGIKLEGEELYQSAFSLFQFFETLIKFNQEDHQVRLEAKGSKTVPDNPLNTQNKENKIK